MNELNKALADISSIRHQMARTTEFRGYGPATLAGTSALALAAAVAQARWLPDPANHISAYLGIWIAIAAGSAPRVGARKLTRTRRVESCPRGGMPPPACGQILPAASARPRPHRPPGGVAP